VNKGIEVDVGANQVLVGVAQVSVEGSQLLIEVLHLLSAAFYQLPGTHLVGNVIGEEDYSVHHTLRVAAGLVREGPIDFLLGASGKG
jgi:hypothetical protein